MLKLSRILRITQVQQILRDPSAASRASYDLIVIGGGVYGAALALESARRGLRPLLLERDDFGAATSWNSLRIVHGGLRYLQSLDICRFRESVRERRRFLRDFPDLVQPLQCLMPLYGDGMRRPSILRLALAANDALSCRRNAGLRDDRRLPGGRVLNPEATRAFFSGVRADGLRGAALWHDALMPASQRVLIEMLRWAVACGATCLNYVEADSLVIRDGHVQGVTARDRETGAAYDFAAPIVVNCAGPCCGELAARFDRPDERLFRPSLAFNLLLDREPVSNAAVAVAPSRPGARTYFLLPWHGKLLAGTYHAPCSANTPPGPPTDEQIAGFLNDINDAVPGLACSRADVRWRFWGLLPAASSGSDELTKREVITSHQEHGGPRGLFSVSGVKFTTARLVAEKTINRMLNRSPLARRLRAPGPDRPAGRDHVGIAFLDGVAENIAPCPNSNGNGQSLSCPDLQRWIADESIVHLDDLLLRRVDWAADPTQVGCVARGVCEALEWDANKTHLELNRLEKLGISTCQPTQRIQKTAASSS